MTIGIAATGPNAGLAVYLALAAVERVASGAIGGFATLAVIDRQGRLHRASTQRGGTRTLFIETEHTGVPPPPVIASASFAALMSSGPERPVPLDQFVAADPRAGLVTGHRLPNAACVTGRPLNIEVLERLRGGHTAQAAVDPVLDADPDADAGVIAVDLQGRLYARNSARVARRTDLGHARREHPEAGAVVEILHNAMSPSGSVAALAADIALETMVPYYRADGTVTVRAGTPVTLGPAHRVLVDASGTVFRIETTDQRILAGLHNCAAIYLAAEVVRDGRLIGHTVTEPNVVVEDGLIVTLSGQAEVGVAYRSGPEL